MKYYLPHDVIITVWNPISEAHWIWRESKLSGHDRCLSMQCSCNSPSDVGPNLQSQPVSSVPAIDAFFERRWFHFSFVAMTAVTPFPKDGEVIPLSSMTRQSFAFNLCDLNNNACKLDIRYSTYRTRMRENSFRMNKYA